MAYYKKITGKSVYLSPMDPNDAPTYTKWLADPAVSGTLGSLHMVYSETAERKFMEKLVEDETDVHLAIVRLSDDRVLGGVSLMEFERVYRRATAGIFIGDAENRGKGYGTETLALMLGFGFDTLNLHNVLLTCHADNAAGLKCYANVGFTEIGRRREAVFKGGRYVDLVHMDILEDEFRGRWRK